MEEKRFAYVEDLINELSEELNRIYQLIYDDKKYDPPAFLQILEKRTLSKEEVGFIIDVFNGAFEELGKLIEGKDEKLNEQYKWLSEKKRKELFSLVDTLVSDCLRVNTDVDPEIQQLEENIRKIAKNEKKEAHQEKQ